MNLERRFSRAGEGRYVLEVPDYCVVLDVDRVKRNRWGALGGELTVRCSLSGASTIDGDLLWSGDVSFSDTRGKADLARQLDARAKTSDLDWPVLLDELGMRVRDAEREGEPAVFLRDVAKPPPDQLLQVDGLTLLRKHPVIIFGDGGSAKSYLALNLAGRIEQTTGMRVGLFDWELGAEDHRLRLEHLFGADRMPGIVYARCSKPLVHEVDRLTRIVQDHRLNYVILDSVAFACDGPPEAAEVAGNYMRAVRSLGVGSLHLAHVSKAEGADQKPFGSSFWHNGARMTWFVKLSEGRPAASEITIGLFNRKANLGPRLKAVGYTIRFDEDRTQFAQVDLADVSDLASKLTIYERITAALKTGPMTIAALAEGIDAKPATVEKTVRRWTEKGNLVRLAAKNGVPTRYGLAALRTAS